MSKPIVTYTVFLNAAAQLEKESQRVSVRTIKNLIGGRTSNTVQFLRKWKEEKLLALKSDDVISGHFKQAMLAEFSRISQKTQKRFENQIADEKDNAQELLSSLKATENQNDILADDISTLEKKYQDMMTRSGKGIAALEARLADEKDRVTKHIKKIESLQKSQHDAETKAAVAQTRAEMLEKQLTEKKTQKKADK